MTISKKEEMLGTRGQGIAATPLYVVYAQTVALANIVNKLSYEFPKRARIKTILVEKNAGTAATLTLNVYDKFACESKDKVIPEQATVASVFLTERDFAFVNHDTKQTELIYLTLAPNAAADNVYNIKIIAEMAV